MSRSTRVKLLGKGAYSQAVLANWKMEGGPGYNQEVFATKFVAKEDLYIVEKEVLIQAFLVQFLSYF